jgi:hypothetical protein
MKIKLLALATLFLSGAIACAPVSDLVRSIATESSAQPLPNLVSLFLVKKDNLNHEFRGEVYPLALSINDRYVDVSQDLTLQVRTDSDVDRLIQLNEARSMLRAMPDFRVVNDSTQLGRFTVDQLKVGQFACSSFLIGQGQFTGDRTLPELYRSLPDDRAGGFSGSVGNRQFDESWKWAIATSQPRLPPASKLPANLDPAQFKPDLLAIGEPLIQQAELLPGQSVSTAATIVEKVTIYDLDRDGQPEVLGLLRKGTDQRVPPDRTAAASGVTVYASVWLSYQNNQPTLIANEIIAYQYPVTRSPSDVIGIFDLNGDGTEEVITKENGYEAIGFSIYELKEAQLEEVFNGAQYGC